MTFVTLYCDGVICAGVYVQYKLGYPGFMDYAFTVDTIRKYVSIILE